MILYLVEVLIDGQRDFTTCGLFTVKEEACEKAAEQEHFGLPITTAWIDGEFNFVHVNHTTGELFDYDENGLRIPAELVPFSEQPPVYFASSASDVWVDQEVSSGSDIWIGD
jgi:hypothetical protein